ARATALVQPYGPRDLPRVLRALSRARRMRTVSVSHGCGAFLKRERYSGGQHPTALMAKLRGAPRARVGEVEPAARRQLVLGLVAMIRTLNAHIKDLEREIPNPGPYASGRSDLSLAV